MGTLIIAIAIALSATASMPAYADPSSSCHFHGSKQAAEATVLQCANNRKVVLMKSGKLDKSWGAVEYDSITVVEGKKGNEWKVVYKNTSEPDKDKSTLYMFFTPPGNFIAANFTGR